LEYAGKNVTWKNADLVGENVTWKNADLVEVIVCFKCLEVDLSLFLLVFLLDTRSGVAGAAEKGS